MLRAKASNPLLVLRGEVANTVSVGGVITAAPNMTSQKEKKMLKKVLVSVIAAGALTVSLAGVA